MKGGRSKSVVLRQRERYHKVKILKANFINNKIIELVGRFALGSVFIYASLDKIAFPREFTKIVIAYHILPERLAIYFGFLIPWVELIFGILLVVGLFIRTSALILSSLLLVFVVAIVINKLSGGEIAACGCFSVNASETGNIFFLLSRDILFLFLGIFLARRNDKCIHAEI
jgi:putative oxidoreductase